MILIVGGAYQGKLEYAKSKLDDIKEEDYFDGALDPLEDCFQKPLLNQFHLLVLRLIKSEQSPSLFIERLLIENPNVIIITNELGYGIVPIDPFDRSYRESAGALCCYLAKEAKEVYRVICGISNQIK